MSEEYPNLPEGGAEYVQSLMDEFKSEMKRITEKTLSDLYVDVTPHVESDHWTNYRNDLLDYFCDYKNVIKSPYDFKRIRQKIYEEYRDEIINDLNQDLLEEIERQKRIIGSLTFGSLTYR